MTLRIFRRTALVLLAAGLVIAVAWARTTPWDAARALRAQAFAAKNQMPAPGAEALLRQSIAVPPRNAARPGTDVTRLGPLQSITYLGWLKTIPLPGLGRRIDSFLATYRRGMLVWRVSPAKDAAPAIVFYLNPEPMTPRQIIDLYAAPSGFPWAFRMAVQLVVLLMFAVIGRKLLRIRLL